MFIFNSNSDKKYFGGIDPSASEDKPSGCAILDAGGALVEAGHESADRHLIDFFQKYPIAALGIDAPKGLPLGMRLCCLEDKPKCTCAVTESRACEREMYQRGHSLYPVNKNTFTSAKMWIRRGLLLYLRFQSLGIYCYEIYPTAAKHTLFADVDFPKPKSSVIARRMLQRLLAESIDGVPDPEKKTFSDHTLDAILAAYTVYLYSVENQGERVGDPREGEILIPTRGM